MRTPEYRARRSELTARLVATGTFYERGWHISPKAGTVYFMSSWEEDRWNELDRDPTVTTYKRPGLYLPYEWEGHTRHYVPDVLITYTFGMVLEEIKPRRIAERDPRTKAKLAAGAACALSQGWAWNVYLRDK